MISAGTDQGQVGGQLVPLLGLGEAVSHEILYVEHIGHEKVHHEFAQPLQAPTLESAPTLDSN